MLNIIACSSDDLSDGALEALDGVSCDAPLSTLGIKNGIVCYSSTDVGATAVYLCTDCSIRSMRRVTVRICMEDGGWNGTIPDCDCGTYSNMF